MKGKGLPAYFVLPTQMHKELWPCNPQLLRDFFFSLERPSRPTRNFIFALERPCCRKKIKKAINKASVLSIA